MCASKNQKTMRRNPSSKLVNINNVLEDPRQFIDYDPRLALDSGEDYENEEQFLKKCIEISRRDGVNLKSVDLELFDGIELENEKNDKDEIYSDDVDKLKVELLKYKQKISELKSNSEKKIEKLTQEKQLLATKLLKELAQDFFVNIAQVSNQQVINNIQINTSDTSSKVIDINSLKSPRGPPPMREEPIERIRKVPPKNIQLDFISPRKNDFSMVVSELEEVLDNGGGLKPIDSNVLEERKKWKANRMKNLRRLKLKGLV